MATQRMTLDQMLETYRQVTAEYQAGRMAPEQYTAVLASLQGFDSAGHWWACQPGGTFLIYDGANWAPAWPPGITPPAQAAPPVQPRVQQAAATQAPVAGQPIQVPESLQSATNKYRGMVAASPILAVVPALACGGLWFLYTLLRYNEEGSAGVDWITPVIVGGIPLLAWIFKKQIDAGLQPLRPKIVAIPQPLRFGIVLGIPLILGCVCSSTATYGYLGLNVSSFVSVVTATILMRY
jgi:hypothetical protein